MITWRPGGARRSADYDWDASLGRTGFINGRRTIEEPNAFSIISREMFDLGCKALVGFEEYAYDHDSLMELVMSQNRSNFIVVFWGQNLGGFFYIEKSVRLKPLDRMTPHENWVYLSVPSDDGVSPSGKAPDFESGIAGSNPSTPAEAP